LENLPGAKNKKYIVLIISALGGLLPPFMSSSINLALPVIQSEFNLDAIIVNWTATIYLLSTAIFLVPFGRAADIYGRKLFYLLGFILYTLASGLCGLANSIQLLLIFRVLQGFGSAMIFGTGLSIVISVFPPDERGWAIGINVASVYLGLSLGPFIGGLFTQVFGWRMIFYVNVPIGLLVIVLILWQVKGEWAESKGEKMDITGSVIYGLGLTCFIYGFSTLITPGGLWFLIGGIMALLLFGFYESRIKHPVLNLSLLKGNKIFLFSCLAALINYSATFAIAFLLSQYLQYVKNLNPQEAGLILLVQPVCQAVLSPLAGIISDKIEPRLVASMGMALTVVGLMLLTQLTIITPAYYLIIALAFLGVGFALFSSPNSNAIISSVERRFYGLASGMVGTMRIVGQNVSMGIVMLITVIYLGSEKLIPKAIPRFLAGLQTSFMVLSVLCFLGIFFSLARSLASGKRNN
jgi:EmrB/QacA subfamily drug resistance transporter